MNFECKQLHISYDPHYRCTIEFSDTIEPENEIENFELLLNPLGKYLLIQRYYSENKYEDDWYNIESSEAKLEYSYKDDIYITLTSNELNFYYAGKTILIGLNLSEKEQSLLTKTFKTKFKNIVVML